MKNLIPTLLTIAILTGCSVFKDDVRIKGGTLKVDGARLIQKQSEDPKNTTSLAKESERIETVILPANSLIMVGTNSVKLSSNTVYTVVSKDKLSSGLGAAQKNVIGQTLGKLKSLAWLTWLGAALVLFGAASAVYPPLKAVVNSITTSAIIVAVGIGFIALPSLIVGHEVLILCIGLGAAGLYWFAHRHGGVTSELATLKSVLGSTQEPTPPIAPPPTSQPPSA